MQIIKATDIEDNPKLYLIYGEGGTGKTSTAKYIPGNKVLLTVDSSEDVAQGWPDTVVYQMEKKDYQFPRASVEHYIYPLFEKTSVDAIVIDNISMLTQIIIDEIKGSPSASKDDRQNFAEMQKWIRQFIQDARTARKMIYITGWETTFEGETNVDMNYTARNLVNGLMDVVGHITKEDGQEPVIQLTRQAGVYAKNRIDDRTEAKASELFIANTEKKEEGN